MILANLALPPMLDTWEQAGHSLAMPSEASVRITQRRRISGMNEMRGWYVNPSHIFLITNIFVRDSLNSHVTR